MYDEPENDSNENDSNERQHIEVEIPVGTDATETLRDHNNEGSNRSRIMSLEEEKERRASIKAILADTTITPQERRRSIQSLMDGRRSSIGTATSSIIDGRRSSTGTATSISSEPSNNTDLYGYGDGSPDGYEKTSSLNDLLDNGEKAVCIPVSNGKTKRAELTRPPCNHYVRNCTMIAPCCGAAFGCRICHDDCPILPPLLIAKRASRMQPRSSSMPLGFMDDEDHAQHDTHHTIDRFQVKEIICRVCYTKQSSKTYVYSTLPGYRIQRVKGLQ